MPSLCCRHLAGVPLQLEQLQKLPERSMTCCVWGCALWGRFVCDGCFHCLAVHYIVSNFASSHYSSRWQRPHTMHTHTGKETGYFSHAGIRYRKSPWGFLQACAVVHWEMTSMSHINGEVAPSLGPRPFWCLAKQPHCALTK